ncbi:MAG TPA: UDP-N-acetylmuramoylalanyl-D-glutamyl-2,6-diaminopimelate--D-alanyl-D-alanine ligase [Methylocella sp.]|nr:UDP-N-acetylmuramoylalanyl-D-glutamyl-2,6-diaminopimelate--D-alanyl-D-alanine ligase [Methylocella sp.]
MSAVAQDNPLWTSLGVIEPLASRVSGGLPRREITGISIDSRTLQQGDLFFAIKGLNSDGHDYTGAAFARGAAAAVVDEAHAELLRPFGPLYVVKDVLAALERLGIAARARSQARIAAVTGSVGKTSTKEALRLVVSQAGAAHASTASYNNHWGVPLTLARMPKAAKFGVFEIGMNHGGEITPLAAMVRPHIAIITTIAPVHLENFRSVDEIADAKAELFSGLVPGGVVILNRDIAQYDRLFSHAKSSRAGHVAAFGEHRSADAVLRNVKIGESHSVVDADIHGQRITFRLGIPGRHFAMNSLAVLLAAKALGIGLESAAATLALSAPQPGRGERLALSVKDGIYTLIDESYNANPASMRAALALVGALPLRNKGRRIAVVGDMLELGPDASMMHAELAKDVAANRFDLVFAAGSLSKHLFDALPGPVRGAWREHAADIVEPLEAVLRGGDIVIVKGSNASRMGTIVEALKKQAGESPSVGAAKC